MGEEIEMPTVDYRASYLAASAELREVRQRAERAEGALRALRLSAHVGVQESIGRGENASAMRFRAIRQHADVALAADPQPAEAGGAG